MQLSHLCQYHVQKLTLSEEEAMRHWREAMHRGCCAYAECRMRAAHIYFGCALDIARLRISCAHNVFFAQQHLVEPLQHLVELHIFDNTYEKILRVLNRITNELEQLWTRPSETLLASLQDCYEKVESAEHQHMLERNPHGKSRRAEHEPIMH